MSFCTVGAPLSPIAPTTSPFTLMGNPPPHAAIRASVGMPAKSDGSLWVKLKNSCVETPNRAVYALFCAISMVGIGAPSIRGRSQSAVSQQIRKLEEQLGKRLFRKEGRGLALTEAGDVVLSYARRILDLNDEAVAAVRGMAGTNRESIQPPSIWCSFRAVRDRFGVLSKT